MIKFKKMIAVLTAGVMLLTPMVANATWTGGTPSIQETEEGELTIETDNSLPPSYCNIVLPTMTVSTYQFVMDPEQIMDEYDSDYDGESSLYFLANTVPLSVTHNKTFTSDENLYTARYAATDTAGTQAFYEALTFNGSGAISTVPDNYFLWVPATKSVYDGQGEFIPVTTASFGTYFDYDESDTTAIAFAPRSGATVSDQKVYTRSFAATDANTDFTQYVSATENKTVTLADGLYYKTGTIYTEYGNNTVALKDLVYNLADPRYVGASDVAKIVNKATVDTAVSVKAILNNVGGLRFSADETFSGGNASQMLYLAVSGTLTSKTNGSAFTGANDITNMTQALFSAANASDVASSTIGFTLKGVKTDGSVKYQGTDGDVDLLTGNHNKYQYEAPNLVYDAAEFNLLGASNYGDSADAWAAYLGGLEARPTVQVIFTLTNTIDATSISSNGVTFSWDGTGVRTFTLDVDASSPILVGSNPSNVSVTGFFAGGSATGNVVNMVSAPGAAMSHAPGNKSVTYTLPTSWETINWNKLVISGAAVGGSTITLTRTSSDAAVRGTIAIDVKL